MNDKILFETGFKKSHRHNLDRIAVFFDDAFLVPSYDGEVVAAEFPGAFDKAIDFPLFRFALRQIVADLHKPLDTISFAKHKVGLLVISG